MWKFVSNDVMPTYIYRNIVCVQISDFITDNSALLHMIADTHKEAT